MHFLCEAVRWYMIQVISASNYFNFLKFNEGGILY